MEFTCTKCKEPRKARTKPGFERDYYVNDKRLERAAVENDLEV